MADTTEQTHTGDGSAQSSDEKTAVLYRMVMDKHICPFGLKSRDLLKREGYEVEDHHLTTREETDAFKQKHGVETTPQAWIDGKRIGGHDDLLRHFGKEAPSDKADETTYQPVIAIFATAALMALATSWAAFGTVFTVRAAEWFISISMCILAIQKLQDLTALKTETAPTVPMKMASGDASQIRAPAIIKMPAIASANG